MRGCRQKLSIVSLVQSEVADDSAFALFLKDSVGDHIFGAVIVSGRSYFL
jgi:hypothetical protein